MKAEISIGLPVYNGENYLEEALESIVSQTFDDFELIISDNASTDGTEEICRALAERDGRVRYVRQTKNQGAAANYNTVFELANAPFFKWCTHDDLMSETTLEACRQALLANPDCVGAMPEITELIDESGEAFEEYRPDLDPHGAGPGERFAYFLRRYKQRCTPFFALFRRGAMVGSGLHGAYMGSDHVFVAEMLLRGRLLSVRGPKLGLRIHGERYSVRYKNDLVGNLLWLDPRNSGRRPSRCATLVVEFARAVGRTKLPPAERLRAYQAVQSFAWRRRGQLVKEFRNGVANSRASTTRS